MRRPPEKQKTKHAPKARSARPIPAARQIRPEDRAEKSASDVARELILDLWGRTRMDWGFASTRLAAALKTQRRLPSHERRRVAETLYGMIREFRRLDLALEGSRLKAGRERELGRYIAYRLLTGEIDQAEATKELPQVDWQAVAGVDARIAKERNPVRHLGMARSFPDWLAERFIEEFGDEADALAASLNQRGPLTLRANILKITRDELLDRLKQDGIDAAPTTYSPLGITLRGRPDIFSAVAFKEGLFEVQDEASQLVAELVLPPPKGLVIDVCAGAGGKTLAVGAAMQSKGRLVALDIDERKLDELRRRARRAGLSSVQAMVTPEHSYPSAVGELSGKVDRILVDAPCDGLGSLRRNPEIRWRAQPEEAERFAAIQLDLARRAIPLLAPGGRLIYATCTIVRAENEAVVERLLGLEPTVELVRIAELLGNERAQAFTDKTGTFLKTAPHRQGADGFFAAVLRKRR